MRLSPLLPVVLVDQTAGEGKEEGKRGKEDGKKGKQVVLGRMAAGIIAHPKNLIYVLSLEEVRAVFWGEIRQWPGAGGAAAPMYVFGPPHNDPIAQLFQEKLSKGGVKRSLAHTANADTAKIVLAVAQDPLAIGFVDSSQVSPEEKSVKRVGVSLPGKALPDADPLARTFVLEISPNASPTARDFAQFAASDRCASTLAQYSLTAP